MRCNSFLDQTIPTAHGRPAERRRGRQAVAVCFLALAVVSCGVAAQTSACGSLDNAYGPYDYRTDRDKLGIVEKHHFGMNQELLIRGRSEASASLGSNIDYTLRAFPNHHRALISMERLGERLRLPKVPSAEYSVECYFVRGLQFAPDDHVVRLLFARYLGRQGRKEEALQQVGAARASASDNAFAQYNAGLVYLELGNFDAALEQAHRAEAMGFPRTELRDRLKSANRWRDPAASAQPAPGKGASEPTS